MDALTFAQDVAPYAGLTLVINFTVGLMKRYLPKLYTTYSDYISVFIGVSAISTYSITRDIGLFTAIVSSIMTYEVYKSTKA